MNRYMENQWAWVEASHQMRDGILELLSDDDLAFVPGGSNATAGALIKTLGEVQHAYGESLKTLKTDFGYRNTEAGLENSLARLKAWFTTLDAEMKATLSTFSDADFDQVIERGSGYQMPLITQMDVYIQALMIFFGKAMVYLRALNKPIPEQMAEWIG